MRETIISLIMCILTLHSNAQTKLYLSEKGKDSNNGTKNHPVQTLQRAVDLGNTINGDVEIIISNGTYRTSQTIEVTKKEGSLVICGEDRDKVFITGDKNIPLKYATTVTDKSILSRIQDSLKQKIRVIDFTKLGYTLENIHPSGFGRKCLPAWSEIFVNGTPLTLSRWPNDSMVLTGKIVVAGNADDKKDGRLPVFHYNESRPEKWTQAKNIWIGGYFGHGYADDMIPVKSINTTDSTIHAADFTTYEFMTGTSFRRWFALNLIEEIDMKGEYVLDAENGKIYFYPPEEDITDIRLSYMEEPLIAIENSSDIVIKKLTIENSRGMGIYMENTENVCVDSCVIRNLGNVGVSIGCGTMSEKTDVTAQHSMESGGELRKRVIGDMMGRIYEDVTLNRNAGRNNGIKNSLIYSTGAGGISLGGGDRKTLTRSDNYAENCKIYDYNRIEKSYRPGVWMDGVGNRITKCDIYNAPSMAILFHGNDHTIELCKITNVCTEVDDQGAIYYGRDVAERGNVIRYNYFKELSPKHRVTATYHDDGACGSQVYGNIYFRAGSLPVLIGGGHDHNYFNNIFIDSPVAIHIDNRMQNWGVNMLDKGGIIDERLQKVNYTQPPYSTAYPEIVNYWSENPAFPKRNTIHGNLFYKINNLMSGETRWGEFWNNWTTDRDPGFVDPQDPLQGFKDDAEIYNHINGFPKLPFSQIGSTLEN